MAPAAGRAPRRRVSGREPAAGLCGRTAAECTVPAAGSHAAGPQEVVGLHAASCYGRWYVSSYHLDITLRVMKKYLNRSSFWEITIIYIFLKQAIKCWTCTFEFSILIQSNIFPTCKNYFHLKIYKNPAICSPSDIKSICDDSLRSLIQSGAVEVVNKVQSHDDKSHVSHIDCYVYDDSELTVSSLGNAAVKGRCLVIAWRSDGKGLSRFFFTKYNTTRSE